MAVTRCLDQRCEETISILLLTEDGSRHRRNPQVVIGSDGLPLISYIAAFNGPTPSQIKFVQVCGTEFCANSSFSVPTSPVVPEPGPVTWGEYWSAPQDDPDRFIIAESSDGRFRKWIPPVITSYHCSTESGVQPAGTSSSDETKEAMEARTGYTCFFGGAGTYGYWVDYTP